MKDEREGQQEFDNTESKKFEFKNHIEIDAGNVLSCDPALLLKCS